MNTIILENPLTLTKTYVVSKIEIAIFDIQLNESVSISISLRSENNETIDTQAIVLTGEDYNKWGSGDEYIQEKVIEFIEKTYIRS